MKELLKESKTTDFLKTKSIAEDTLKLIDEGLHKELIKKSVGETKFYPENINNDFPINLDENYKLNVVEETSIESIIRLNKEGKKNIGILNFASAKKPGGGFLNGRVAQEETLARSSSLYYSLIMYPEFYKNTQSPYYSDNIIFSPDVVFFKDNNGFVIDTPILASVITCAAPNLTNIESIDQEEIKKVFRRRINNVLNVFKENNCKNIVLGAWGCGVFKNNPNDVSKYFKQILNNGTFDNYFESVTFSIYDSTGKILEAFRK